MGKQLFLDTPRPFICIGRVNPDPAVNRLAAGVDERDDWQWRSCPELDLFVPWHRIEFDCGKPELRHTAIGAIASLAIFGRA
jgi:hypothetical protein